MFECLCIVFIVLIIFFIIYYLSCCFIDNTYKDYQNPVKLENRAKEENKKEDEEYFKQLINYQNNAIYAAMRENKKETQYKFYEHYQQLYPNKYKDEFTKRADRYYKNYKIDRDKISWE